MKTDSSRIDSNYTPRKDWSGQNINGWKVLRPVGCLRPKYVYNGKSTTLVIGVYECQCECGKIQNVRIDDLRGNKSRRCHDCSRAKMDMMARSMRAVRTRNKTAIDGGRLGYWNSLLPDIPRAYGVKLHKGAKSRELEFSITADDINTLWIKQNKKCALSGIELQFGHKDETKAASVDRIDSSKGYSPDNIQIISRRVNRMKSDLSQDAFLNLARKILETVNG